jgi:hypothetical protein
MLTGSGCGIENAIHRVYYFSFTGIGPVITFVFLALFIRD